MATKIFNAISNGDHLLLKYRSTNVPRRQLAFCCFREERKGWIAEEVERARGGEDDGDEYVAERPGGSAEVHAGVEDGEDAGKGGERDPREGDSREASARESCPREERLHCANSSQRGQCLVEAFRAVQRSGDYLASTRSKVTIHFVAVPRVLTKTILH